MSLVTVGAKDGRKRIYQRKFDHEIAQQLRSEGWSYERIARELGVSGLAVARVCDPKMREKMDQKTREWMERQKRPCPGGCGRLVWMHGRQNREHRTGLCAQCLGEARCAADVRPDELRCTKCREWKPDAEFRDVKDRHRRARRGRNQWCRSCENAARRDHRLRNSKQTHDYDRERHRKGKEKMMVVYIVLSRNGSDHWQEIDRVEASTPVQAVEKAASDEGSYAAFAESSIVDIERTVVLRAKSRKGRVVAAS